MAAVAVAFNQLDYALGLCRRLEDQGLVNLNKLADRVHVSYVDLLRDLLREANSIQAHVGLPTRESEMAPSETVNEDTGSQSRLPGVGLSRKFVAFWIPQGVYRMIEGRRNPVEVRPQSTIANILNAHGLKPGRVVRGAVVPR